MAFIPASAFAELTPMTRRYISHWLEYAKGTLDCQPGTAEAVVEQPLLPSKVCPREGVHEDAPQRKGLITNKDMWQWSTWLCSRVDTVFSGRPRVPYFRVSPNADFPRVPPSLLRP